MERCNSNGVWHPNTKHVIQPRLRCLSSVNCPGWSVANGVLQQGEVSPFHDACVLHWLKGEELPETEICPSWGNRRVQINFFLPESLIHTVYMYPQRCVYASGVFAKLWTNLQLLCFTKQRGWAGTWGYDILALLPGCQHVQLNLVFPFCSCCEK